MYYVLLYSHVKYVCEYAENLGCVDFHLFRGYKKFYSLISCESYIIEDDDNLSNSSY